VRNTQTAEYAMLNNMSYNGDRDNPQNIRVLIHY